MTDCPYTDADLRAEAARQHAGLTDDPDFVGVGEQMDGTPIPSTVIDLEPEIGEPLEMSLAWNHIGNHHFEEAQRKIHDLVNGAADVSEWAVNLGADGLEPTGHVFQLGMQDGPEGEGEPVVRMHFAFRSDLSQKDRDGMVVELAKLASKALSGVER